MATLAFEKTHKTNPPCSPGRLTARPEALMRSAGKRLSRTSGRAGEAFGEPFDAAFVPIGRRSQKTSS